MVFYGIPLVMARLSDGMAQSCASVLVLGHPLGLSATQHFLFGSFVVFLVCGNTKSGSFIQLPLPFQ